MALLISGLKSSPGLPGAGGADYPATRTLCANAWGDAVQAWAASIVPASTAVAAAVATLKTSLDAAFASGDAAAPMEAAFTAFAATVGTGMLPAFVAVPPPITIGFAILFATNASTRQAGVDKVADAIHAWALTGTATPSGGGAPVNWS